MERFTSSMPVEMRVIYYWLSTYLQSSSIFFLGNLYGAMINHLLGFFLFFAEPFSMQNLSSLTEMEPPTPSTERRNFSHWTAREVPIVYL